MYLRFIALGLMAVAPGCNGPARLAAQEAEAKSTEAAEIDKRATIVAAEMVQKNEAADEKKRVADAQKVVDTRKEPRQKVTDHPGDFLEATDPQVIGTAARHLTSVSLTNKSQFAMTDIRGTLDFHGGVDFHGDNGDVLAQVPVQLTGSIAPGASMVFSEQQHTLSGAAIQLANKPSRATFTVTGVQSVGTPENVPPPSAGDH